MPGTDDSPIAALDPTPSRLRVSAGFVVGLSVSLVLHGVLLGLLLMRQGAAGTQSNAPASPLLIDWQAAVPLRTVPAPPRTAPARTPTPTMRESASAAPRSLVAAPAPHRDAADERSAVNTLPMPPTTVETGARDDATTAAPPQPASAVSGDDPYLWDVLAHLRRFQHYPERARQQGVEGTVWLRARVSRQGEVLRSEIERSSGHAQLDAAATRLIAQASPLPPPPAGAFAITDLSLPVEYRLRRE